MNPQGAITPVLSSPFLDSGEAFGKIPYQCESAFDHNHSVASNKAITVLPLDYSTTFTKTIGVIEGTVKRQRSRSIDKPVSILANPLEQGLPQNDQHECPASVSLFLIR